MKKKNQSQIQNGHFSAKQDPFGSNTKKDPLDKRTNNTEIDQTPNTTDRHLYTEMLNQFSRVCGEV